MQESSIRTRGVALGVFALLGTAWASATSPPTPDGPRLYLDREVIDFGSVFVGAGVRDPMGYRDLRLHNCGDAPLYLERLGIP